MAVVGFEFTGKFKAVLQTDGEPYLRVRLKPSVFPSELVEYCDNKRYLKFKNAELSFAGDGVELTGIIVRAKGFIRDVEFKDKS